MIKGNKVHTHTILYDYSIPTLFISECVLIYLEPNISQSILELITKSFPISCIVTYEQIMPYDMFGKTMIANLSSRQIRLLGLEAYPTLDTQKSRYIDAGFTKSEALDLVMVWNKWVSETEKNRYQNSFPCFKIW